MEISLETYQLPAAGGDVTLIKLTNAGGASVVLSTLGAGIVEVNVPDSTGTRANVALGYRDVADYLHDGPNMGKTPGRFANRIGHGRFTLDGKEYQLAVNCGPHHLHGGPDGFQNRIWSYDIAADGTVTMRRTSPAGEEGYPGTVEAMVRYRWDDSCRLTIEYEATTDASTPLGLTNHTYWNLDGEASGSALEHTLQLHCKQYLETDPTLLPTGLLLPVEGTPMDFTWPKEVGRDINADFAPLKHGKGYDHCYFIDGYDGATLRPVATLRGQSGRTLTVESDLPGVQLYTANWLTGGTPTGRSGTEYKDYDAVALECQMLPDSPNRPEFPDSILRPGQVWRHTITYKFDNE
ncbi:MAG: galactose mutarotase [Candidatus Amulumruptor caecigallinarius]|nr:galactose mutarotase [Candidatus Amulumruptor caecigallinarius]MCM1396570.1 galactose mutarotase [Candidatus Amulumruptor caecigallinarius]MCM1453372.1 galactose mutarotase [bacterium]